MCLRDMHGNYEIALNIYTNIYAINYFLSFTIRLNIILKDNKNTDVAKRNFSQTFSNLSTN